MIIIIITTAQNGNSRDPDDLPALPCGLYLFQQAKKCTHVYNEEKNKQRITMAGQYAYKYKQYIKCYYYYCKNVNERFLRPYLLFILVDLQQPSQENNFIFNNIC